MRQPAALAAVFLIALAAMAVMRHSTVLGPGLANDSIQYVRGAQYLLDGEELQRRLRDGSIGAMVEWPPAYPVAVAALGLSGVHLYRGARWLSIILFGANVLLIGLGILRWSGGQAWAAVLGALLATASVALLQIHAWAWSEPLFLFFTLAGLLLLGEYVESAQPRLLALAAAAGALTRYSGLALVGAGVLCLLLLAKTPLLRRARMAVVFAAVGATPVLLWMTYNLYRAGSATGKDLAFHNPLGKLPQGVFTVSSWLVPGAVRAPERWWLFALWLLALAALGIWLFAVAHRLHSPMRPLAVPIIFIPSYAALTLFSLVFIDIVPALDDRIMCPILVPGLIAAGSALGLAASSTRAQPAKLLALALCGVLLLSYAVAGEQWVQRTHRNGNGFTGRQWRDSPTLQAARELIAGLPANAPIVTNADSALNYLTGRLVMGPPHRVFPTSLRPNAGFNDELAHMALKLHEGKGIMVVFDFWGWPAAGPNEEELQEAFGLVLVQRLKDGSIYRAGP